MSKYKDLLRFVQGSFRRESWEEWLYFSHYGEDRGPCREFVSWVVTNALSVLRVARCLLTSHDWVDEGYAGPDSGCIDMVCQRCGWSHRHILY